MPQGASLEDLNAASVEAFVGKLANVVEHSPWIAETAARTRPFSDVAGLARSIAAAIGNAPPEQKLKLLRSHPDLANKVQRAQGLTPDSIAEQDSAGLDRLSEAEFTVFEQANAAYKAKFGFPFIVCVRRHTRDSILDRFERRLRNAPDQEEAEAVREVTRIATLRLAQQLGAGDALHVYGRLSTHVLDTHAGRPAEGVEFELMELSRRGENRLIARTATNRDGRTDGPLIAGRPLPIGTYELRFRIGDYFSRRCAEAGDPPFLDVIPLRFSIAEPESHYHVPLLVTPWSYTTYRGS